jgi:phosphatidylserine/phosphatidylglycerophosphate/cardiolipin synthase-like enzyme
MLRNILNHDHLAEALNEALTRCRHRLIIATANVKNLHVPTVGPSAADRGARSILEVFEELSGRNVEIRLLHSAVPSQPFLDQLKAHVPRTLTMRRCPRVHAKALIADGRWMYLGSANLTGAGLGAKSPRRRNFEAGICTDDLALIDKVSDMLDNIWNGAECPACGRKDHCPVPLEQPQL